MAIVFRPQRGSLRQSLSEAMIFDDADHMKEYLLTNDIVKVFGAAHIELSMAVFNDKRIGWRDTRHVYFVDNRPYMKDTDKKYREICIGYCATDIDFSILASKYLMDEKLASAEIKPQTDKYASMTDIFEVLDRFLGYLDDDMIYRLKYAIKNDCTWKIW